MCDVTWLRNEDTEDGRVGYYICAEHKHYGEFIGVPRRFKGQPLPECLWDILIENAKVTPFPAYKIGHLMHLGAARLRRMGDRRASQRVEYYIRNQRELMAEHPIERYRAFDEAEYRRGWADAQAEIDQE